MVKPSGQNGFWGPVNSSQPINYYKENIAKKTGNIAKQLSEIQTFRTKNMRNDPSLKIEKQRDIILNNFL